MKRLDRLLIAAALVLAAVIAADALRGHRSSSAPAPAATTAAATLETQTWPAHSEMSLPPAPVPERVRLVPSTTAFLRNCPARSLALGVGPGPILSLSYAGGPCHVPPLRLHAVVRNAAGRIVYRGPALAHEDLSGNYAGKAEVFATLAPRALAGCRSTPLRATISGSGLRASGPIRCLGGP